MTHEGKGWWLSSAVYSDSDMMLTEAPVGRVGLWVQLFQDFFFDCVFVTGQNQQGYHAVS